jgi:chromate transport protein ChrA
MFDWVVPILIIVLLLIKILDSLDMLEGVTALLRLIAAAAVGIARLTVRLVRHLAGASRPQP